jgi:hypothetical protein
VSNLYFYLNNFKSMQESGITLFELTVVNNWFVIMEGHAIASGNEWSRIFFMTFYVFTMIVMTIIVAFILEAFLFRIQYKQFLTKNDGIFVYRFFPCFGFLLMWSFAELRRLTKDIMLTSDEMEAIVQHGGLRNTPAVGSGEDAFRIPQNVSKSSLYQMASSI